jgi:hypothetical protein
MKASFLLIGLLSAGVAFAAPPAPKKKASKPRTTNGTPRKARKLKP